MVEVVSIYKPVHAIKPTRDYRKYPSTAAQQEAFVINFLWVDWDCLLLVSTVIPVIWIHNRILSVTRLSSRTFTLLKLQGSHQSILLNACIVLMELHAHIQYNAAQRCTPPRWHLSSCATSVKWCGSGLSVSVFKSTKINLKSKKLRCIAGQL